LVVLGGIAVFLWITFAPTSRPGGPHGGSVAAMGSMATGIGEAIMVLLGGLAVSTVSAVMNGISLALETRPISKGRKFEFGIFLLPTILVIFAGLSFAMHWR
jgi:hypothetical protein